MHELGITQEIVARAEEHARGGRVTRVVVEIGRLTAVLPDAVRFCFDLCTAGTCVEGAELEIIDTPGLARCRLCDREVTLDGPFGQCQCGHHDLEWLAGHELKLRRLEVM
jgi:hydrogenase nickel incorporation protein HypA/HybF